MRDFFNWLFVRRYKAGRTMTLSDQEREELSAILNEPVMQKALIIAEQKRPPLFSNEDSAEVRLALLRGWELHRMALINQVAQPMREQKPLMPTYPIGNELKQ